MKRSSNTCVEKTMRSLRAISIQKLFRLNEIGRKINFKLMMHDSSENIIRYFRELLLSSVIDTTASLFHCFSIENMLREIITRVILRIFPKNYIFRCYFFYDNLFSFYKQTYNARFILMQNFRRFTIGKMCTF